MVQRTTSLAVCISLLSSSFAMGASREYTVQPNEVLTRILDEQKLNPIYGRDGSLLLTLTLNPALLASSGNKLFPGQIIQLPAAEMPAPEAAPVTQTTPPSVSEGPRPAAVSPPDADRVVGALSFGLGVDFFKIDATDSTTGSKASIISNASPTFDFGAHFGWDEQNSFSILGQVERYSLQAPDAARSFSNDSGARVSFGAAYTHHFSPRFGFGAGLFFAQDLFFHSVSASVLSVDSVLITKPTINASYELLQKKNASVGVDAAFALSLPNSNSYYSVHSGTDTNADLHFNYFTQASEENFKQLQVLIGYRINAQDTSVMSKTEKSLWLKFLYTWALPW